MAMTTLNSYYLQMMGQFQQVSTNPLDGMSGLSAGLPQQQQYISAQEFMNRTDVVLEPVYDAHAYKVVKKKTPGEAFRDRLWDEIEAWHGDPLGLMVA